MKKNSFYFVWVRITCYRLEFDFQISANKMNGIDEKYVLRWMFVCLFWIIWLLLLLFG